MTEGAGLAASRPPELALGTPAREAWEPVARSLGIGPWKLAEVVARHFRLEVADLGNVDGRAAEVIPERLAREHHVLPLAVSQRHLALATCDPTDMDAERSLRFRAGRPIVFRVAPPGAIRDALSGPSRRDGEVAAALEDLGVTSTVEAEIRLEEAETTPAGLPLADVDSAPVSGLANRVLRNGIEVGASDIHLEPGREKGTVRFRVDGVLRFHMALPMEVLNRVISRIKILGKLDITDRLRPQDGKARVFVRESGYDLRISTLPAGGAEKCVVRVLDSSRAFSLAELGIPGSELDRFRGLLSHRDGIVLVTGPTGSGKTTTLYGALQELADGEVNVMSVEDPVEYDLPSITQTQIAPRQGVTFASALRAILRQDPDVILVGEIRDRETAETAAQAALTGHLVLATVHANDSVSAVARLADLGLQHPTVAAALRGTVAQRLLRRACPDCMEPVGDAPTEREEELSRRYGEAPGLRAVGCAECGFTGYQGRLPVLEVMTVDPRIEAAIELRKGPATLQRLAVQAGMRSLEEVGLEWVRKGRTTLVELERVIGRMKSARDQEAEKRPPRILVADDDGAARLLMSSLLEEEGYEVRTVEDGRQAMDALEEDPYCSLLVLDLVMPRADGREVLRWVRGGVDTAAIPVLVRTGTENPGTEVELLEQGADDYLPKEAPPDRFLARVRAVLRRAAL